MSDRTGARVGQDTSREAASDPLVVADGVTKALRAGDVVTPVLRGVSLTIPRGSFAAIIGPSGCGKTTFLSLLGALDRADGGRLVVDGVDLMGLDGERREAYQREKIGLVLQFFNLLPTLDALENVETALETLPLSAAARRACAMEYLDRVGLADDASKFPAQMSGGMQQRVAVARAVAREPPLLLADEPTGNLDRENAAQVFELIASLQRSMGMTCIVVTHDPALAARCGLVHAFEDGRVRASRGSPA
jgi:ABC-type lipoprotein export system ATPase subunit